MAIHFLFHKIAWILHLDFHITSLAQQTLSFAPIDLLAPLSLSVLINLCKVFRVRSFENLSNSNENEQMSDFFRTACFQTWMPWSLINLCNLQNYLPFKYILRSCWYDASICLRFFKKSASDSILHGFVLRCAMCIQSSDTFVLCIYPGWFCAFLLDLSPRGPCAGESHPQGREAGGQPLTIFGPH